MASNKKNKRLKSLPRKNEYAQKQSSHLLNWSTVLEIPENFLEHLTAESNFAPLKNCIMLNVSSTNLEQNAYGVLSPVSEERITFFLTSDTSFSLRHFFAMFRLLIPSTLSCQTVCQRSIVVDCWQYLVLIKSYNGL